MTRSLLGATRPSEQAPAAGAAWPLQGLPRRFGALVAVDDVTFSAETGRITAVIGPNGAGKSTLFGLIAGALVPDAGTVRLFGNDLGAAPPHVRARLGLARTFQAAIPFPNMTVQENVMVGMHRQFRAGLWQHFLGLRPAAEEEAVLRTHAGECLAAMGLEALRHTPASVLTAGQQRLLAVARAVAGQPEGLMLDEPAAGLNESERAMLAQAVRALRSRGMTILLIEHAMDFVMELADHIVVLNHGVKLAEGSPAEIRRDPEVVAAYLGID